MKNVAFHTGKNTVANVPMESVEASGSCNMRDVKIFNAKVVRPIKIIISETTKSGQRKELIILTSPGFLGQRFH